MLPLWLPKCYHMVRSPSLSPIVLLSRSPSLSWPITGAVFDCGPDKWELYDLSPGLAVPSPGLILKPNSSPSPRLPPYHCTPHSPPHPFLLQLQGKAVFWQEMNSSQMSAGTWEVVRKRRTPLRRPGLLPAAGGMWASASLTHASTPLPSTTPPDWLTACLNAGLWAWK